jgi:hypothetical protein
MGASGRPALIGGSAIRLGSKIVVRLKAAVTCPSGMIRVAHAVTAPEIRVFRDHPGNPRLRRIEMASRLVVSIASILFGVSSAFAEPFIPCDQSMITGVTWQAIFVPPSIYSVRGFACPLTISSAGIITVVANCAFGADQAAFVPVTGTLNIDSSCQVVGQMTINLFDDFVFLNGYTESVSASLWRSVDGSRLSGFMLWSGALNGVSESAVSGFEMILVPTFLERRR